MLRVRVVGITRCDGVANHEQNCLPGTKKLGETATKGSVLGTCVTPKRAVKGGLDVQMKKAVQNMRLKMRVHDSDIGTSTLNVPCHPRLASSLHLRVNPNSHKV